MSKKANHSVSMLSVYDGGVLVQEHVKVGALNLPGGSVEDNESPLDAFYREMNEELGLVEDDISLITIQEVEHIIDDEIRIEHRFVVRGITEWVNREPEKHSDIRYVPIPELKTAPEGTVSVILKSAVKTL